jgi:hypothetical protein
LLLAMAAISFLARKDWREKLAAAESEAP